MAITRGGITSFKRRFSPPHTQFPKQRRSRMASSSMAATAPAKGIGFDYLSPLSFSPTIFGFVKRLGLQTVAKELGNVPWYSVGNLSCMNQVWLDQGLRVVVL